jgi:hypothetical protein
MRHYRRNYRREKNQAGKFLACGLRARGQHLSLQTHLANPVKRNYFYNDSIFKTIGKLPNIARVNFFIEKACQKLPLFDNYVK